MERANRVPVYGFRWVVITLLFMITLVNYIDRSAISFALGDLQRALHLNNAELGAVLGGFGIGYMFMIFLGGILVDRFGARYTLMVAVVFWAISMFLTAWAPSFIWLVISRVLLGFAEGVNFPAITRVIADWLSSQERIKSLSYTLIAVPLATMLSAPIVSCLIIFLGWRGSFLVLGAMALLWIPFWMYYFRNNPQNSRFVSAQELSNIIGDKEEAAQVTPHKVTWGYLFTQRTLLANYFAFFVFGYFLFFFVGWLPEYFAHAYHINLKAIGLFVMLPWLLAAILMWVVSRVVQYFARYTHSLRVLRSYPIMVTQLLASLCVVPLVVLSHPSLNTAILWIALAVGFSMSSNACYYAVNIDLAKERAATALGIMGTGTAVSGFIAPFVTGYLIDITHSYQAGFMILCGLGLLSVIVVWRYHYTGSDEVLS